MKRTRQSNQVEYCPVCCMRLTARFAAASHYNKHARCGELEKNGNGEGAEYRLNSDNVMHNSWWRTGFHVYGFDKRPEILELERKQYLVKLFIKSSSRHEHAK